MFKLYQWTHYLVVTFRLTNHKRNLKFTKLHILNLDNLDLWNWINKWRTRQMYFAVLLSWYSMHFPLTFLYRGCISPSLICWGFPHLNDHQYISKQIDLTLTRKKEPADKILPWNERKDRTYHHVYDPDYHHDVYQDHSLSFLKKDVVFSAPSPFLQFHLL